MRQRTAEQPQPVRIEPCEQEGFVAVVITVNVQPIQTQDAETKENRTEYESDVYRLTYPEKDTETLREYAKENIEVFAELAEAEENDGKPTQNADKLAALMIENTELRTTQDDIIIILTDMMGGVE